MTDSNIYRRRIADIEAFLNALNAFLAVCDREPDDYFGVSNPRWWPKPGREAEAAQLAAQVDRVSGRAAQAFGTDFWIDWKPRGTMQTQRVNPAYRWRSILDEDPDLTVDIIFSVSNQAIGALDLWAEQASEKGNVPKKTLRAAPRLVNRILSHPLVSAVAAILIGAAILGGIGLLRHGGSSSGGETSRTTTDSVTKPKSLTSQIEGGNIVRATLAGKKPLYADPLTAKVGAVVTIKTRITTGGPDPLTRVRVTAAIPGAASASEATLVTVSAADAGSTESDAVTIRTADHSPFCLHLVRHTTHLVTGDGGLVRALPDTITKSGVEIGDVQVSLTQVRLVSFDARLVREPDGTECQAG